MMIVRLSGGLGNQLFQFAAAKVLEKKYGWDIIIDDSYYSSQPDKDTLRKLEILQFSVNYSRKSNVKEQKAMRRKILIFKLLSRIPLLKNSTLKHNLFHLINIYDEECLLKNVEPGKNDYIIGYFQDYGLLADHINVIRQEFTLTPGVEKEMCNLDTWGYIAQHKNTVAVHIRRGDYVNNVHANTFHGLCGIDYYKKAINLLNRQVDTPRFVFFSDDYDWVKDTFSWVPDAYFVDNRDSTYSAVDMWLMSLCNHNIIANSTYSWWSAVLNSNTNKIVICPEKWTLQNDIGALHVTGWIKL